LTGDVAGLGTSAQTAVHLAVNEINNKGGIQGKQIRLIEEDNRCNAQAANNAVNKLISVDHVQAIIGGLCSTETSAFDTYLKGI
jgi:branched-chain amino acid transport system substrate-binding protein